MKLGILSDVHGDLVALETVLDRLDNVHQVDLILCAGDLIARGPEEDRVVDIFRERDVPTVCGNHDELVHGLSRGNRDYLKSLPLDWEDELEGVRLFMCHGKPGNNLWGLYRDHASDTLLSMMLKSLQVDVLITGHTHVPLYVRLPEGCVVNPGSICTFKSARYSSHTYGVLNLPDLAFELYDVMKESVQPLPL
jgi:putative phosphoesterase